VRAIVTGGAGFVGSHVVDALLARGDEVHVLDDLSTGRRENVAAEAVLHVGDVREDQTALFAELRPETCFHLAAQADVRVSVERPEEDAAVNVIGTIRMLEAARSVDADLVFSSTGGAIYGECEGPAAEDHPLRPLAPYGTAKLAAEEYLRTWNRLHGSRHVTLRFANVFGPRQEENLEAGVVAIFMRQLTRGEQPRIFGDGRQTRDFVYVGDVARACLAASRGDGSTFNVGTGVETSVLDLYARVRAVAGSSVEAEHAEERPGEIRRSVVDPSLAASGLGWRPEVSLEEGLERTWAWVAG
jgi:UDP-glucose 4-epimerase